MAQRMHTVTQFMAGIGAAEGLLQQTLEFKVYYIFSESPVRRSGSPRNLLRGDDKFYGCALWGSTAARTGCRPMPADKWCRTW
jgi:hypothetical protein